MSRPLPHNLKLYTAAICPFAQRVTITLHELGLLRSIKNSSENAKELEIIEIDLSNKPEYPKVNPRGKVPALALVNSTTGSVEKTLIESALIAEYVADEYDDTKRLHPTTSLQKYDANFLVDFFCNSIMPRFYSLLKAQETTKQDEIKSEILKNVKEFTTYLPPSSPYLLGTQFTLGDVLCAPFLARWPLLQHYRNFEIPKTQEFERYHVWSEALLKRESVKGTLPDWEDLVKSYKSYADGSRG
ncbi:glutathione S-transferase [Paraphysoderma sedebokerense]|nr:glutathione S-transferase [Paraphysoderma sedebokerense]